MSAYDTLPTRVQEFYLHFPELIQKRNKHSLKKILFHMRDSAIDLVSITMIRDMWYDLEDTEFQDIEEIFEDESNKKKFLKRYDGPKTWLVLSQ